MKFPEVKKIIYKDTDGVYVMMKDRRIEKITSVSNGYGGGFTHSKRFYIDKINKAMKGI